VETASLSMVAPEKQDDQLDLLCQSLSDQLGPFGYQWLCACAVFPVLQLALTVHLGEALASAASRPRPSEQELLAICRLPWFRKGWIPDELRLRLVRDVGIAFRNSVRDAISQFVFAAIETSSRPYDQTPASFLVDLPRNWPALLDEWIAVGSEDTGPDTILLSFMRGRPVDPALLRDLVPNRTIVSRMRELLDQRTLVLFLIAIALSAALWMFADEIASFWNAPVVNTLLPTMPTPEGCRIAGSGSEPQTLSFEVPGIARVESCVLGKATEFLYEYIVRNISSAPLTVQWEGSLLGPTVVAPGSQVSSRHMTTSPPVMASRNVFFRATGLARSVPVKTLVPGTQPRAAIGGNNTAAAPSRRLKLREFLQDAASQEFRGTASRDTRLRGFLCHLISAGARNLDGCRYKAVVGMSITATDG
jgi:hypothetical protein